MPFRQQASDYDCVPTSFINALSYLFHRKEIPPFVVHRIYKECLDLDSSRGTSSRAVQDLGFWLRNYKEKGYDKFSVEAVFIRGRHVHLRESSKIINCFNVNGVALLCVHSSRNNWHYMLGLRRQGEWLECYDPSPRSKKFIANDAVKFIETSRHQEPNLLIRLDWLDKNFHKAKSPDELKYILGSTNDRECLLLTRVKP